MVTGYSIAIDVAPFTTYRDIQKIVGDLLPANGEGLVNVLLGRNNSAGNDFPNTAVLQSKIGATRISGYPLKCEKYNIGTFQR
jgi:hypothetical protein